MTAPLSTKVSWPVALRRYLAASVALHFVREILQFPLYTIWSEPIATRAFAVLRCTIGDLMIAGLSLLLALGLTAGADWPGAGTRPVWLLLLISGVGYTVYSEWLDVSVRGNWLCVPLMPTLPHIGTGLAPLLQWLIVPTLTLLIATRRLPWRYD